MNIIHNQNATSYGSQICSSITYLLEGFAGEAVAGGGYARVVKRFTITEQHNSTCAIKLLVT